MVIILQPLHLDIHSADLICLKPKDAWSVSIWSFPTNDLEMFFNILAIRPVSTGQ